MTAKKPDISPAERNAQLIAAYGEEAMLEAIEGGMSLTKLAAEIGLARHRQLREWIKRDPERQKRFWAACEASAESFADLAQQVLFDLKSGATHAEVQRARDLASHYRWEAKMRNRAKYGDQQVIEVRETVQDMSDEQLDREIAARTARAEPLARPH